MFELWITEDALGSTLHLINNMVSFLILVAASDKHVDSVCTKNPAVNYPIYLETRPGSNVNRQPTGITAYPHVTNYKAFIETRAPKLNTL